MVVVAVPVTVLVEALRVTLEVFTDATVVAEAGTLVAAGVAEVVEDCLPPFFLFIPPVLVVVDVFVVALPVLSVFELLEVFGVLPFLEAFFVALAFLDLFLLFDFFVVVAGPASLASS